MDLETAAAIVETMVDRISKPWDEDYMSAEEKLEALKIALGCMNSIMFLKKVIK